MFILVDEENGNFIGPFKTEADAKRYAKLNDWGPAEGTPGRFGGGWNVAELDKPDGDEATPPLYKLVLE